MKLTALSVVVGLLIPLTLTQRVSKVEARYEWLLFCLHPKAGTDTPLKTKDQLMFKCVEDYMGVSKHGRYVGRTHDSPDRNPPSPIK